MSRLFNPPRDLFTSTPTSTEVALRKPSSPVPNEVFYACKDCYRLFRCFDKAVKHFRTSVIHADKLHHAIQNSDSDFDDDESIDAAAATMITTMTVVPELLPEPSTSLVKRKAVPAVVAAPVKRKGVSAVAAPVKKTRLDIDFRDNRNIQNVLTGYNGEELTEALKAIKKEPATTLDGAGLTKAAVTDVRYTDSRNIQNVFTKGR